ncbi:MAG TPA: AAA family ATPase [Thermoanaerobaculia bacterium]|nr:AAA family ATPase [Thermoanaerobaculia bacterium]
MILLLNGAFGIGKTTVARSLVARLPRAVLFDPELIGVALQRTARLAGRRVDDFQDLPSWRWLTVAGLRATRLVFPNVVVPMAFSNAACLEEIRRGLARFEPQVSHFCLVAPAELVHERLRRRGGAGEWEYRRASECCLAHQRAEFAIQISADGRRPEEIADELLRALPARHV